MGIAAGMFCCSSQARFGILKPNRFANAVFLIIKNGGFGKLVPSIERTQPSSGFNLLLTKIFYYQILLFPIPLNWFGR